MNGMVRQENGDVMGSIKPFSTMMHFHIYFSLYLTILYSFRTLCGD